MNLGGKFDTELQLQNLMVAFLFVEFIVPKIALTTFIFCVAPSFSSLAVAVVLYSCCLLRNIQVRVIVSPKCVSWSRLKRPLLHNTTLVLEATRPWVQDLSRSSWLNIPPLGVPGCESSGKGEAVKALRSAILQRYVFTNCFAFYLVLRSPCLKFCSTGQISDLLDNIFIRGTCTWGLLKSEMS